MSFPKLNPVSSTNVSSFSSETKENEKFNLDQLQLTKMLFEKNLSVYEKLYMENKELYEKKQSHYYSIVYHYSMGFNPSTSKFQSDQYLANQDVIDQKLKIILGQMKLYKNVKDETNEKILDLKQKISKINEEIFKINENNELKKPTVQDDAMMFPLEL